MERLNTHQIEELLYYERSTEEKIIGPLLHLFEEQILVLIPAMILDLQKQHFKELSKKAHCLRSSAEQLGLESVAQICLNLETESCRDTPFSFFECLGLLQTEVDLALSDLAAFRGRSLY